MNVKVDCDASPLVSLMTLAIAKAKATADPMLPQLQAALDQYYVDCTTCKKQGDNDYKCLNTAIEKLLRNLPFAYQSVYPWKNYDWDYGNYVDNQYSAQATGSSGRGSLSQVMKNLSIFIQLLRGYLTDPNPGAKSKAGSTDSASDYPIYGCQGNNAKGCQATWKVKNSGPEKAPYPDPFFNRSTTGENASSYFVRVGSCAQPVKSEVECTKKGYHWYSTGCFSDRYAWINNTPGLQLNLGKGSVTLGKGYFPTLANDLLSLTPDKMLFAMLGKDITGYMELQKCPTVKETFTSSYDSLSQQNTQFLTVLAVVAAFTTAAFVYAVKKT